ncbi:MAG TPA: TonB-dependent receptor [Acidobacteriaceae bacterium]|nr:TonB-dependent receptor [Acidobacteriaceae bacterium]
MQRYLCLRTLAVIAAALLITLAGSLAHGQATQGTIIGSIRDSAGAVVPNAGITLTSLDEGNVRTAVSNGAGDYRFVDIKAGHYSLRVEAHGFDKWVADGVVLTVRQVLRVDATLAVGTVQQEVVVNGTQAAAIDTDTATISSTFTSQDAIELPVNTRASFGGTSAYNILGVLPGMQGDQSYTGGFSLQGSLPYQLEVTVDGMTLKNPSGSSVIGDAFPSSESISEIRADGVLANAEYGDPAQVVVTTRSGTNSLHGTGYFYYQSSNFDAIPYTYPITTTKPSLQGKTFGASAGGPVVFPHLYNGRKRTFFFGAYEGWRHPAQTTILEKVPSTLMKQGNFSKYASSTFTGLSDPYDGSSWGTQIPSARISQIAQNVLKQFYPDPNIGDPSLYTDDNTANYEHNADSSGHSDQFDVRGDQYIGANQKFLVWGSFTWKDFPTNSTQILNLPSSVDTSNDRRMRIDTNWTLNSRMVNEAAVGFTFYTSGSQNSFNGLAWTNAQGWQGLQNLFYNGIPEMDFNFIQNLNADRLTGLSQSKTWDYTDTFIWTRGKHIFKFGADVQTLEAITPLGFNGSDNYGTYTFNTSGSTGLFTGVDFADFLIGTPDQTFYDVVRQDNDGLSHHYAAFAQDEWRATPRLTLTYGLRYELHPGYYDRYGDIGNFDSTYGLSGRVIYPQGKQALLAQSYLASANACDPDGVTQTNSATINGASCMPVEGNDTAGYPDGLKKYPHLRFLPRLGFAFRPSASDRWVVSGGAGLYNINMLGSSFYSLTGTVQAQTQQFVNTYNPTTHAIGYQWPQIYAGAGSSGCANCYGTDYFGTANSINWQDPYTVQWVGSVERDFGSGYAGRVSYIGSETHHEVWAPDENTLPFSTTLSAYDAPITDRKFPNWGRINNRMTSSNASYNSFQAEGKHRLQNGLEFDSLFTWAKSLADNQGPGNLGFAGEGGGNRATSILDRHADFGNVYGSRRLKWNTTMLYALPFGRGRMFGSGINRLADLAVGGWQLSNILTVQSGPFESPYFPSGEGDPSGTGSGLNSSAAGFDPGHRSQPPDKAAGESMSRGRTRLGWYNRQVFTCPGYTGWQPGTPCTTGSGSGPVPLPIGRFGNAQAGPAPGPGLFNLSTGLSKSFAIAEGIQLRAEGTFTNILNHTNLGDPNMNISSPSFGQITNTIGADFGGARTGQVDVRLEF